MAFDSKIFNAEVFGRYVDRVPRVKQNALLNAGVLRTRSDLAAMLSAQAGGNIVTVPMYGLIGGTPLNYDGATNITAQSSDTFKQTHVVVGRAQAWQEYDFSYDITGANFMQNVAAQVGEYWDDVDQSTIIATLNGVFGGNHEVATKHTHEILDKVGATALNDAAQKACGDNKQIFTAAIMHSSVATDLENLRVLEYAKYTDKNGIEMSTSIATWNGRTVLVDDSVPVESGYYKCASTDAGALQIVASNATDGQITLANVKKGDFYPADAAANMYVVAGTRYTTYILGRNAIDFANCGARVPSELYRDPKVNGGVDMLISRQRKIFTPYGMSFANSSMTSNSPTAAELATAANWVMVPNSAGTDTINHKAVPIARILSR